MENLATNLAKMTVDETGEQNEMKWGMQLNEIYRLALKFYKGLWKKLLLQNRYTYWKSSTLSFFLLFLLDKSGKAVHLSYEDNLKLVALTMQASHGPISQQKLEPLGEHVHWTLHFLYCL
jgi:hypothetical protein